MRASSAKYRGGLLRRTIRGTLSRLLRGSFVAVAAYAVTVLSAQAQPLQGRVEMGGPPPGAAPLPDVFSANPGQGGNPGQGLDPLQGRPETTPTALGPGGNRCVALDPSWRLIQQNGNTCHWFAPFQRPLQGYIVVPMSQIYEFERRGGRCAVNPFNPNVTAVCQNMPAAPPPPLNQALQQTQPLHPPMRPGTMPVGPNVGMRCAGALPQPQYQQAVAAGCRWIGGYDICANPDWYIHPQCVAGSRPSGMAQNQDGAAIQRGALQPFVAALNAAVDSVPGLGNALLRGSAISQDMADRLRNDYNPAASPYAGLRLIRDALLGEGGGLVGSMRARVAAEVAPNQLAALVSQAPSAIERSLAQEVASAEAAEDEAVANALAASPGYAQNRLQALTNLEKIAKLKDVQRGANSRINKIVYWLQQEAQSGGDPATILSQALEKNSYSPLAKALTMQNLLANLQGARAAGAFTQVNMIRLRLGMSAILANGAKLDIDHIVPVNVAQEVGTVLANLRLTPATLNRSVQDVVTESVVEYARLMNQAGLLSDASLAQVTGRVRYVR